MGVRSPLEIVSQSMAIPSSFPSSFLLPHFLSLVILAMTLNWRTLIVLNEKESVCNGESV